MSSAAEGQPWSRPYAPFRPNDAVNEDDSWRFRCPRGHVHLEWVSAENVFCGACSRRLNISSYDAAEIEDAVTGRTLAGFLQEDPLV